ncbi:MAG TPA: PilN domain-containing protein [Vicinamibacterales bacterium]|jgi:Tfp pilus assembly protein PilN
MLRTNLSTRPFYNERGIRVTAAVVALLMLALAAWQGVRIVRLSRYKTELQRSISRDQREAEVRRSDAAQIRRGVDEKALTEVMSAAREANGLIEQRTFSWTELFNQLEAALPDDVMLIAIRPEFKDNVTEINLDVQGRSYDDINTFWDRLEKTGAFHNVDWSTDSQTDENLHKMSMRALYTPVQPATRPAAATSSGVPAPTPSQAPMSPPKTAPRTPAVPTNPSKGSRGGRG